MRKILPYIIVISLFAVVGFQTSNSNLQKLEIQLTKQYKDMLIVDAQTRNAGLSADFRSTMKSVLSNPTTWDYPFDSLSRYIKVVSSPDKQIRIFSWDEFSGGRWHDMAAFAQYKDKNHEMQLYTFNTSNSWLEGDYNDVIYYEVHEFELDKKPHYVLFGWGSHGVKSHFNSAEIFYIEDGKMKKKKPAFSNHDGFAHTIGVEAYRNNKFNMQFDASTNSISFTNYTYDPVSNRFIQLKKKAIYKLTDGFFQLQ